MAIGPGIQVMLRLLPQQFERLECSYYCVEGFAKQVGEMGAGGMISIPGLIKICSSIQHLLGGYTYRHTGTNSKVIS
jgi:hypothetical protein